MKTLPLRRLADAVSVPVGVEAEVAGFATVFGDSVVHASASEPCVT